jgi:hypothetical protein
MATETVEHKRIGFSRKGFAANYELRIESRELAS